MAAGVRASKVVAGPHGTLRRLDCHERGEKADVNQLVTDNHTAYIFGNA